MILVNDNNKRLDSNDRNQFLVAWSPHYCYDVQPITLEALKLNHNEISDYWPKIGVSLRKTQFVRRIRRSWNHDVKDIVYANKHAGTPHIYPSRFAAFITYQGANDNFQMKSFHSSL